MQHIPTTNQRIRGMSNKELLKDANNGDIDHEYRSMIFNELRRREKRRQRK